MAESIKLKSTRNNSLAKSQLKDSLLKAINLKTTNLSRMLKAYNHSHG